MPASLTADAPRRTPPLTGRYRGGRMRYRMDSAAEAAGGVQTGGIQADGYGAGGFSACAFGACAFSTGGLTRGWTAVLPGTRRRSPSGRSPHDHRDRTQQSRTPHDCTQHDCTQQDQCGPIRRRGHRLERADTAAPPIGTRSTSGSGPLQLHRNAHHHLGDPERRPRLRHTAAAVPGAIDRRGRARRYERGDHSDLQQQRSR